MRPPGSSTPGFWTGSPTSASRSCTGAASFRISSAGSIDPDCGYLGHTCPGLTYSWDFGDGSPTTSDPNPNHTYAAGTYTATLTVIDNEGAMANPFIFDKSNIDQYAKIY